MRSCTTQRIILALAGTLLSAAASASVIVAAPIDVVGHLPAAIFTADHFATQSYKDWGNEPSVAVDPLDPSRIVVSSFAFGTGVNKYASIFYSTTAGQTWTVPFSVPPPQTSVQIPNDWRFAYDGNGTLHAAILGGCGTDCNVYSGATSNPASVAAWTYAAGGSPINSLASRNHADQPWIALSPGKVFVAYDDFHTGTGERVAVSTDNGQTFTVDNPVNNGPQANSTNPGTRIATDSAGNVYAIFGVGTQITPGVQNVTYYLNRSRDGGVTWDFNGRSTVGGIAIDTGVSTQLCNAPACTQAFNNWFAGVNDLRGNVTAIAADRAGAHVYALIGKRDASGTDRIYLVAYLAVGANLVQTSEIAVSPAGLRAALPSITVQDNGVVDFMYQTYDSATNTVQVHVARSTDFGASIDGDVVEYSFVPLPLQQVVSGTTSNREFGDYLFITALGNSFYGSFAGRGDVNAGGIDTTALIDPFFFAGGDVALAEPPVLPAFLAALTGAALLRRRRQHPLSSTSNP